LLAGGDKVKVSIIFRAREITHPEVGEELLKWFYEQVEDIAEQERKAGMEGRFMTMTLDPNRKASAEKKAAPAVTEEL
jgi:translation initiation factor IF-3